MSVKIKGKIIAALPETGGTSKSGNTWRKRDYVLETGDKYSKKIAFSVMNDNIAKCNLSVGCEVEVDLDIDSREYNGKWYTSCSVWNATHLSAPAVAPVPATAPAPPSYPTTAVPADDDLPF